MDCVVSLFFKKEKEKEVGDRLVEVMVLGLFKSLGVLGISDLILKIYYLWEIIYLWIVIDFFYEVNREYIK